LKNVGDESENELDMLDINPISNTLMSMLRKLQKSKIIFI